MMRTLFGLESLDRGEIMVRGEKVTIRNPNDAMKAGIGFVTEDRKDEGLVLDFSIRDNMVLTNLYSFAPKGVINDKKEQEFVDILIKRPHIKTQSSSTLVRNLSGGINKRWSSPNGLGSA